MILLSEAVYHARARGLQRIAGRALFVVAIAAGASNAACAKPSATESAMALVRQHRDEDAIGKLRERVTSAPEDVAARRLLVRLLASSGDLAGAKLEVAELERRSKENDPMPRIELGHAYELAHQYEEALAAYDEAAAIAPASAAGPREGGMRCARWGEVEAARPRLEEAIKRGARDAVTFHTLGLVNTHLRDFEAAERAYRAGAAADPKGAENWLGLATLALVQGDAAKALEAYDAVLARSPRYAAGQLGRAWALAKLGRRADAARALDRAEELGAPRDNVAKQRAALGTP